MMLRPSVVVVCILAGLIHPLYSQQARKSNPQNITVGTQKDHVVDLCVLARALSADSIPNQRQAAATTVSGPKRIQLQTVRAPKRLYSILEHDDFQVSYPA